MLVIVKDYSLKNSESKRLQRKKVIYISNGHGIERSVGLEFRHICLTLTGMVEAAVSDSPSAFSLALDHALTYV
jgi:hypothetical protein